MKVHVLVLKDLKANVWGMPFFVPSVEAAARDITANINDPNNKEAIARFPEQFELYRMMDYDDATGSFNTEGLTNPQRIALLSDWKTPPVAADLRIQQLRADRFEIEQQLAAANQQIQLLQREVTRLSKENREELN